MRLQAALMNWGGSRCLRGQQLRALPQGWQTHRRTFRPLLTAASAGGSPEQEVRPHPADKAQQPSVQQPPGDAWELACQQVAAFQRQHGRLPRARADAEGPLLTGERPLALWCTEQQRRKAGSKGPPLTAQEQAALQAIPCWGWWATKPVAKPWEQWRQEVEAFYQQHGRLPRRSVGKVSPFLPGEKELGPWVNRQRQCYKGNIRPPLSAECIVALEATPGWAWEDYSPWNLRYEQLQDFVRQHGRLPREKGGKSNPLLLGEKELGVWCSNQRHRRKGTGTAQQARLDAVPGWYWDVEDDRWEQQRRKLEAFVQVHGRVPRYRPTQQEPLLEGERELALWRTQQRRRERGTGGLASLSTKQQAALDGMPFWHL